MKTPSIKLIPFLLLSLIVTNSCGQEKSKPSDEKFRIMFYNVENLFDPFDDPLKNDQEFVSGGVRGWSWKKFETKLKNLSKVIIAAGEWEPPEIVAFSEVENKFVLIQLLKRTPLGRFDYSIIHEESPDDRGIDVGLIYRRDKFKEISHKSIPIHFENKDIKTRDILYVKGVTIESSGDADTLHLFVNHWPSRTGGPAVTAYKRKNAALVLKRVTDSLFKENPRSQIILMGDFNDEPIDESIKTHLNARLELDDNSGTLYCLMTPYVGKFDTGTNKYKNQWGVIDQFIVSGQLLDEDSELKVTGDKADILAFPFLLIEDQKYSGTVPFRTYNGMKYIGGFSDHLPIMLTLQMN